LTAAVSVVLLLIGVAGAVLRPFRLPPWALALAAVLVDVAVQVIPGHAALDSVRPLADPVAFLLAAVPLAVLLDRLGFFRSVAIAITGRGGGAGALWVLGALVTTVLNLDAGVVLLTPLYVQVARQRGDAPLLLACQPVLLACLASSALPVSNLTNLIASAWTGAGPGAFLGHLALPSAVASTVGWLAWRRMARSKPVGDRFEGGGGDGAEIDTGLDHTALWVGGVVVFGVLVGFTAGSLVGVAPWIVALVADVALVAQRLYAERHQAQGAWGRLRRALPWQEVPLGTAAIALTLGVLAAGAAAHLPVHRAIGGTSVLSMARTAGVAALGANVVNNLPALLVALPAVGHHATPALWAVLLGVNMGPVLLVTGSLASLLWLDTLHRLDVPAHALDFSRIGVRVGLPAAVAGLATELLLHLVGV
jgi:arsenical pump membrane protein